MQPLVQFIGSPLHTTRLLTGGWILINLRARQLTKCSISIQSERRKFAPYGLFGGENGRKGKNILVRKGKITELPSKTTYRLLKDDIIRIETPGVRT
jgi:N-methylhydantoinase B/oxoprolinase/acetone carboxylase alpha subunit